MNKTNLRIFSDVPFAPLQSDIQVVAF